MLKPLGSQKLYERGFTLLELMIVVAIVSILATVAVQSYQAETRKSRRTDARSALMDLSGREEKLFSVNNAYSSTAANLGYPAFPATVGSGYYTVSVQVPDPTQAPTTATTYLITATPVAGGLQASDTACTTLTLNQLGQQGSTGTGTVATCWGN
jgi:type IV pilus assembly protein PilE